MSDERAHYLAKLVRAVEMAARCSEGSLERRSWLQIARSYRKLLKVTLLSDRIEVHIFGP